MLSDFLQFFLKNWDTLSTCHIFQVRHLKTPLVNLGKPVTGLLEIRIFIPILATFSWRLDPCRRLAIVGLHSSGDRLDCLSLSHTFTSWKFFTVTTVCWKRKKPLINKSWSNYHQLRRITLNIPLEFSTTVNNLPIKPRKSVLKI